jgi:hypothetical protein
VTLHSAQGQATVQRRPFWVDPICGIAAKDVKRDAILHTGWQVITSQWTQGLVSDMSRNYSFDTLF